MSRRTGLGMATLSRHWISSEGKYKLKKNSLINVIDFHPVVIQPDQLASFEDVCAWLCSVGSHRLVIAELRKHEVISWL